MSTQSIGSKAEAEVSGARGKGIKSTNCSLPDQKKSLHDSKQGFKYNHATAFHDDFTQLACDRRPQHMGSAAPTAIRILMNRRRRGNAGHVCFSPSFKALARRCNYEKECVTRYKSRYSEFPAKDSESGDYTPDRGCQNKLWAGDAEEIS